MIQRIRLAKLYEHSANQWKDFLHKQSRKLVDAYDCVCVEDKQLKRLDGRKDASGQGKAAGGNGWGIFLLSECVFLAFSLPL